MEDQAVEDQAAMEDQAVEDQATVEDQAVEDQAAEVQAGDREDANGGMYQ